MVRVDFKDEEWDVIRVRRRRSPKNRTASFAMVAAVPCRPPAADYLNVHEPISSIRCGAAKLGYTARSFQLILKSRGIGLLVITGGLLSFFLCCRQARLVGSAEAAPDVRATNGSGWALRLHGVCASLRQACCPAASRINCVISSGWEISERWPAFTSMVLAPIRLAMKRSRSGLMVRSSVEIAYSWAWIARLRCWFCLIAAPCGTAAGRRRALLLLPSAGRSRNRAEMPLR